jgi:hypothetical protein
VDSPLSQSVLLHPTHIHPEDGLPKRWITFNIWGGSSPKTEHVYWAPAAKTEGQEFQEYSIPVTESF